MENPYMGQYKNYSVEMLEQSIATNERTIKTNKEALKKAPSSPSAENYKKAIQRASQVNEAFKAELIEKGGGTPGANTNMILIGAAALIGAFLLFKG